MRDVTLPAAAVVWLSVLLLGSTAPAGAACFAVQESATAGTAQSAGARAARKALTKIARSQGAAVAASASLGEPACLYLDDGSNRVRCTVTASACTAPPAPVIVNPPSTPSQPSLPRAGCTSLRAKATGNGLAQAQGLVRSTLDQALRQRLGTTLAGAAQTEGPQCVHLDNGTNQVTCEMSARVCR